MSRLILCTYVAVILFGPFTRANIPNPLTSFDQLPLATKTVDTTQVQTAKIILADYSLIKNDFPQLVQLTNEQIDSWLLQYASYITIQQAQQTLVNTEVITTENKSTAYRPSNYGRALIFQTPIGLIDAKGVGSIHPMQKDHKNGLATLGEVIREYLYEKMVNKILQREKSFFKTIGSYAVISWGFQVKFPDGNLSPAGAILRQSHTRHDGLVLPDAISKKLELLLRPYGLTTAGAHRTLFLKDMINVQGNMSGEIIDFGAYLVVNNFVRPATNFQSENVIINPADKENFPQPDESVRLPEILWGSTESRQEDPKNDNPWRFSHRLADDLFSGKAERAHAEMHLRTMIDSVDSQWTKKSINFCPKLL